MLILEALLTRIKIANTNLELISGSFVRGKCKA